MPVQPQELTDGTPVVYQQPYSSEPPEDGVVVATPQATIDRGLVFVRYRSGVKSTYLRDLQLARPKVTGE